MTLEIAQSKIGSDLAVSSESRVASLTEKLLGMFRERHVTRCGLLLDPVLRDARPQLASRQMECGGQPLSSVPVRVAPGLIDKSHWPVFVEVDLETLSGRQLITDSLTMALADWDVDSRRKGLGHRICAWTASSLRMTEVAAGLPAQLVHRRPDGRRSLLRFYDPAVTAQAWRLCTTVQQQQLLGPIDCWISMGAHGDFRSYEGNGAGLVKGSTTVVPEFSSEQWRRLDQIGPINRALARLPVDPEDGAMGPVADALLRAQGYGFMNLEDLAEFAWRAFTVSPWFDSHPRIKQCITTRNAGDSFGYATADLTETHWSVIAMEANAGRPQ